MRPLKIYNIPGQETRTLVDKVLSAGSHNLVWDGKGDAGNQVATGISLSDSKWRLFGCAQDEFDSAESRTAIM